MTYDQLYGALKRIKWLRSVVRRLRGVVERTRIDTWVLAGSERNGGNPMTVFVAGQLETKNYITGLLFKAPFSETHRRMWRSRLWAYATSEGSDHVLAFVDTSRPPEEDFSAVNVFWSRGWVRTELDLARAAERIQRSSSIKKTDVRKIRKNGLSYDTTTDPQEFEQFYWDMYVPYARQEFGGKAIYMNYEEFRAGLKKPELLRVHKDGQVVAGMIILYGENDRPHWWILGMQNGDRELMKQGAMGALYLYGIQHLTEQGYSHALLGGVRPFLIDGVLQYKRKWGARLIAGDDGDPHWLMVAVTRPTEAVRDFLGACPLICEEDQGLVGRVLLDHTGSDDNERIQRQIADLTALGVERVEAIEIPRGAAHDDVDREETAQLIGARGNRRFTQRFGMRAIRRRDSNVSL